MSRFFRLIKYEFSKLAQRTTTKISILCIVLAILGANLYFMISQQNSGTDQDEWMSYNRVALSMAEENYRQLTSFTIYEEAQARQLSACTGGYTGVSFNYPTQYCTRFLAAYDDYGVLSALYAELLA